MNNTGCWLYTIIHTHFKLSLILQPTCSTFAAQQGALAHTLGISAIDFTKQLSGLL